ncbi:hypothetical protein [Sorangium sp. So ce1151]|uniref:hypothetical protein n=1 Tax=Sorangium sp. So ce1151 TaxID=3133332 RepID=UPI003F64355E
MTSGWMKWMWRWCASCAVLLVAVSAPVAPHALLFHLTAAGAGEIEIAPVDAFPGTR